MKNDGEVNMQFGSYAKKSPTICRSSIGSRDMSPVLEFESARSNLVDYVMLYD
jgi:hypothetical protein